MTIITKTKSTFRRHIDVDDIHADGKSIVQAGGWSMPYHSLVILFCDM